MKDLRVCVCVSHMIWSLMSNLWCFCPLPGGVDNLLHSSTLWLRPIHRTLNTNISVEANCQDTGTPWTDGGVAAPTHSMTSVQCIMGILVWITRYCETTVMILFKHCTSLFFWVFPVEGALSSTLPICYIFFLTSFSSSLTKKSKAVQLRLVAAQLLLEENALSWSAHCRAYLLL